MYRRLARAFIVETRAGLIEALATKFMSGEEGVEGDGDEEGRGSWEEIGGRGEEEFVSGVVPFMLSYFSIKFVN